MPTVAAITRGSEPLGDGVFPAAVTGGVPPSSAGDRRTIPGFTTLRGLLAVWVVCFHFWPDLLVLWPSLAARIAPLVSAGNMAVPGFFILSGTVMVHTYRETLRRGSWAGARTFLLARLARVYPVHLATLLVLLAMAVAARAQGVALFRAYDGADFVRNLLLIHAWSPYFQLNWNFPSWSLSAEWFAYCLFPLALPLILQLATSRSRTLLLITAAVLTGGGVAAYWSARPFYELSLVCPTFLAGTWIACLPPVSTDASRVVNRWVARATAPAIVAAAYIPDLALRALTLTGLFALCIAALYRGRNDPRQLWRSRLLVRLGDVSYSLYMTHVIAKLVANELLPLSAAIDATVTVRWLMTGADVAIIAAVCWASFHFVEAPARAALRPRGALVPAP